MVCIEKFDRNAKILELYNKGYKRKDIAKEFGLSNARIDQILWRLDPSIRKAVKVNDKQDDLSQDILKLCLDSGLDYEIAKNIDVSQEDVKDLIESNDIVFFKDYFLSKGAKEMKNSKPSSRSLLNFLQNSDLTVFTTESIIEKFGQFHQTTLTKSQVGSFLNTLKKHGYVVRTLRGTYETTSKIKPIARSIQKENIDKNVVEPTVEKINSVEESQVCTNETKRNYFKKVERIALENYINMFKVGGKRFVFTTEDLHKFYSNLDKIKLSKAIQNMHATGILKKGSKLGEYIFEEKGDSPEHCHSAWNFEIIVR
jgi:transposase